RETVGDVAEDPAVLTHPLESFYVPVRADNYVMAGDLLSRHADLLDPGMRAFAHVGAGISALDYLRATQERTKLSAQLATFFEQYDLLVTPTVAVPPFVINTRPKQIAGRKVHVIGWIAFTYPFNF